MLFIIKINTGTAIKEQQLFFGLHFKEEKGGQLPRIPVCYLHDEWHLSVSLSWNVK